MTNVGTVFMDLELANTGAFSRDISNVAKSSESKMSSAMSTIGSAIKRAFVVTGVAAFSKASIDAASKSQSAWTGLNSVLRHSGSSFKQAEGFINDYISDGLVPLNNAVGAYKNLLLRGYNTSEIEQVMKAFKDSAAFSRQSSYSMGDAIETATEGLKNENSVIVDNVGVTKNVAKMWDEYAQKIGTTANRLTLAQKRQAEVNGIIAETQAQIGDAKAYTDTYAGKVAQLGTAFMNLKIAIGSVLAPLAGAFIPILTAAINVVTRFFNIIAQVMSVLGIKFPKVIDKGAKQSVGGFSKGVDDATKKMGGAGKQAKKTAKEINRAFASVDELNIVNIPDRDTSDSSGGGGGAGAGGGAGEMPALEVPEPDLSPLETVSPKIQAIADEIKRLIGGINFKPIMNGFETFGNGVKAVWDNLIKPTFSTMFYDFLYPLAKFTIENTIPRFLESTGKALQNIDFTKFNEGFKAFVKPLEKVAELASGALMSIYEKVILPIAQTVISDVVPGVFKALGGALELIAKVWEKAQPAFDVILDFAGSIASDALKIVGEGLSLIGDMLKKISENEVAVSILTALGEAALIFFGAWEVVKLIAFIEMAGGLAGALGLVKAALWESVGAKVADKIETMEIIGLYAKDAFAKGLSEAKTLALKAATVANTVATKAAAAATWLFNGALTVLTSPITLVVVAIAALIAIVVLLIKNWDKVKEVAIKCWESIKKAWNAVSEWFNKNVVQPVAGFFSGMWNGIKTGASNVWNGIKSVWSNVFAWFDRVVISPIRNAFNAVKSAVVGVFNGIKGTIQNVMGSVGGFVKAPINGIISGINRVISKINSLKVPDWVPVVGGKHTNFPQIPMLAQGGYVRANNPQLAIIGDNRREGEIVAPESKIAEAVRRGIANADRLGISNPLEINLKVEYEDGRVIARKINTAQIEDGRVLLNI